MTTPRNRLCRLMTALEAGRPVPDDVAEWMRDGIAEYLVEGGRRPLDVVLGLRGRGIRSFETQKAMERRNAALMAALEYAHDGQWRPVRWRANYLADAVKRFRRKWPRIRHLEEPPDNLDELQRALFRAFQANERVPEDPDHIMACCRKK